MGPLALPWAGMVLRRWRAKSPDIWFDFPFEGVFPFRMEMTALIHDCATEGETGYAATCVEFPEANGQGETVEECVADLRASLEDVRAYRRETATRNLSQGDRIELLRA